MQSAVGESLPIDTLLCRIARFGICLWPQEAVRYEVLTCVSHYKRHYSCAGKGRGFAVHLHMLYDAC